MKHSVPLFIALMATPALAEGTRHMEAHVHGVGEMNIAIDGDMLAMEFHVPGADIVGFEYAAESAEDHAAIENAVALLTRPSNVFVVPEAAGCTLTETHVGLERGGAHDDHDDQDHEGHHDDHEEGHDHKHEDHAGDHDHDHDEKHDEHAEGHDHDEKHEDHAEGDDHKHDDHAEGHDDHDDHDHEEAANHTEFHAEYALTCTNPAALTSIRFAYFDQFENAREVDVQAVSPKGAQAFEVTREAPVLDLSGLL